MTAPTESICLNCFTSLPGCYGKSNFYYNCKSAKFNLIASQPGKKSDFATVIIYQKGQQFYFNNLQLKEPNSYFFIHFCKQKPDKGQWEL